MMFLTGRRWVGSSAREVALEVFEARARSGVYVFEAEDGTAVYVGKSENELGSRVQRHEYIRCARVWALESTCPSVDEVQLIARLLPQRNRETQACPGDVARPKVADTIGAKEMAMKIITTREDAREAMENVFLRMARHRHQLGAYPPTIDWEKSKREGNKLTLFDGYGGELCTITEHGDQVNVASGKALAGCFPELTPLQKKLLNKEISEEAYKAAVNDARMAQVSEYVDQLIEMGLIDDRTAEHILDEAAGKFGLSEEPEMHEADGETEVMDVASGFEPARSENEAGSVVDYLALHLEDHCDPGVPWIGRHDQNTTARE